MPDARCTRGLVCKIVRKKAHTSIQVQRRHSGIPCARENNYAYGFVGRRMEVRNLLMAQRYSPI